MSSFSDGYEYFLNIIGGTGGFQGHEYIAKINSEVDKLTEHMNKFNGYQTDISKLKGDVAEFWHADTHNIDAALNGKNIRAYIPRSNKLGSVDVQVGNEAFSLKYYKNGAESAKQQAKSFYERYREYLAQSKNSESDISFEKYLHNNNISDKDIDNIMHSALYGTQGRLIPSDQLKEAAEFLKRKIAEESMKRPELVQKYQETLDLLTDKIKSNQGTESIPLSEEEAKKIASLAKEGNFDPKKFGISTEELVTNEYIFSNALKAGLSAAVISAVLNVAPEIYKMINILLETGELDKKTFLESGRKVLSSSSEGFLKGGISAAITIACQSGKLGETAKLLDCSVISAVTVIALNAIKNSYKLATKKITKGEFADACMRDLFVTCSSVTLGMALQAIMPEAPVFGYLLGSFVGSMASTFIYQTSYKVFMSFCIESGFTFFGIVDQEYRLSDDILKQIGVKVLEYDRIDIKKIGMKKVELKTIEQKQIEMKKMDVVFVRRGVIGVNKIGYV